jgi:glycosyltransferase involved in cell wall biosynthesis
LTGEWKDSGLTQDVADSDGFPETRSARPLVSVVIPTFNRAHIVTRAIDSVLAQTYCPCEILVVDDGSSDNTADVLQSYADRIVYIRQKNSGPAAARNRGIRESKGEFIAFLDSDDVWLGTKIERQATLLQRAGQHVPCCLCNSILEMPTCQGRTAFDMARLNLSEPQGLCLNPAAILATRFILFVQSVMVRRSFLLDCGGFDEHLWLMEDHDLALRLALRGPWALVKEPLTKWCGAMDDGNLSVAATKQPNRLYESIEYIDCKLLERETISEPRVRGYLQRELRSVRCRLLAGRWIAAGGVPRRFMARGILAWDRFRQAWFRRSRSYPRARVEPLVCGILNEGKTMASEMGR